MLLLRPAATGSAGSGSATLLPVLFPGRGGAIAGAAPFATPTIGRLPVAAPVRGAGVPGGGEVGDAERGGGTPGDALRWGGGLGRGGGMLGDPLRAGGGGDGGRVRGAAPLGCAATGLTRAGSSAASTSVGSSRSGLLAGCTAIGLAGCTAIGLARTAPLVGGAPVGFARGTPPLVGGAPVGFARGTPPLAADGCLCATAACATGGGVVGEPVRAGGGVVGAPVRGAAPVGFARAGPLVGGEALCGVGRGTAPLGASPFASMILSSSALRSADPGGGGGTVRGFLRPGSAGALGSDLRTAGVAAFGVADGD